MSEPQSRREFAKKVAYTVPLIATLSVAPRLASAGSNAVSLASTNNLKSKGSKTQKVKFAKAQKRGRH